MLAQHQVQNLALHSLPRCFENELGEQHISNMHARKTMVGATCTEDVFRELLQVEESSVLQASARIMCCLTWKLWGIHWHQISDLVKHLPLGYAWTEPCTQGRDQWQKWILGGKGLAALCSAGWHLHHKTCRQCLDLLWIRSYIWKVATEIWLSRDAHSNESRLGRQNDRHWQFGWDTTRMGEKHQRYKNTWLL